MKQLPCIAIVGKIALRSRELRFSQSFNALYWVAFSHVSINRIQKAGLVYVTDTCFRLFIPFWLLNQDMLFHGYNCFLNYTSLIPAYAGIPFFKGG